MEITGKIKVVCPAKTGVSQKSGNAWKSQDFVVETEGDHPESCVFSVFGEDKISEFNLQVGELITVSINLDAREYNGRWFNSLRAWRVMKAAQNNTASQSAQQNAQPTQQVQKTAPVTSQEPDDQLPF